MPETIIIQLAGSLLPTCAVMVVCPVARAARTMVYPVLPAICTTSSLASFHWISALSAMVVARRRLLDPGDMVILDSEREIVTDASAGSTLSVQEARYSPTVTVRVQCPACTPRTVPPAEVVLTVAILLSLLCHSQLDTATPRLSP